MPVQRFAAPAAPARPDPEPNVTPLIDVLLVLLVIFMLAQAVRAGLDAQLPPPSTAEANGPVRRVPPIVLELTAEGGYAVNRQPVPAAALDAQLRALLAGREARVVFVDAAPERSYREVVAAMDLARGAGAQLVGLVPGDELP